ncbi:hypothetical protein [Alloactinosynnema sp. L-07]|uniref:DUF7711 family protein n=1 Tax=Alloactinosynnema sp. L-07 TaxID=1653480 RepID=UPI00065EF2AB|nr:hypothetical protein [Alloactinosynnema sp. L-07]CRK57321.1 hypothetical protein [Alloactinosynnema sp. L-07]
MKRARALHHLRTTAETCADMATRPRSIFPLRVDELWAAGEILTQAAEIDTVTVALVVDLPPGDAAWLTEPHGSQHWAYAARLQTAPVTLHWRSASAPVWNHALDRPVLIWTVADGINEDALRAIADNDIDDVRLPAPSPGLRAERLADELAVSLRALRACTATYTERRWKPGKLEPTADALWHASEGYLDLLGATESA